MFKIGNVTLTNNVVMGPMAGITNLAFRSIIKDFSVGLVYSEMVSDKAINYGNLKTRELLKISANEHPISVQLFGNELASMVKAAQYLDQNNQCDIIDINMGCPMPKITGPGSGCALMKDPDYVYQLVKAIVTNVNKPVTVKIRSGLDKQHINAVEVALACEAAQAAAIAVHPRTKRQLYGGKADWEVIRQVKNSVKVPVIGNGDIRSAADAQKMIAATGCDAVMLARGVLGNPWLAEALVSGKIRTITDDERLDMILEHARRLIDLKGESIAVREMRGQAGWYINGLSYNNKVKAALSSIITFEQMQTILAGYRTQLQELKDADHIK